MINLFRFIRQLHFYGFKKSETVKGYWTFSHPNFTKDNPDGILQIRRKSRKTVSTFAGKEEFDKWKEEMSHFRNSMVQQMHQLKQQFDRFESMMQTVCQSVEPVSSVGQKRKFEFVKTEPVEVKFQKVETCPFESKVTQMQEFDDNLFAGFPLPLLDTNNFPFEY